MLEQRIPLIDGYEDDVFSGWRRYICRYHRAGETARVKRRYRRRVRRQERCEVQERLAERDEK